MNKLLKIMRESLKGSKERLAGIIRNIKEGQFRRVPGFEEKKDNFKNVFKEYGQYWTPQKNFLLRAKEESAEIFVFRHDKEKKKVILDDSAEHFDLSDEREVRRFLEHIDYEKYIESLGKE